MIVIGRRAKNETEAFINRHLNDRAKGWPKTGLCSTNFADYCREEQEKSVKYQEYS